MYRCHMQMTHYWIFKIFFANLHFIVGGKKFYCDGHTDKVVYRIAAVLFGNKFLQDFLLRGKQAYNGHTVNVHFSCTPMK